MPTTSAGERKFGGYFGVTGSFLARRDEAAWQAPCNEEQRCQGRSRPAKWVTNFRSPALDVEAIPHHSRQRVIVNTDYRADGASAGAGQERRAFERLRVRLPAQLRSQGSPATLCEIRDFCIGGMFVVFHDSAVGLQAQASFSPVVRDAIVELSCEVPTATSARALRFRARVARRIGTGLGLAFVNPDFSALQVLHQFADAGPLRHAIPYQTPGTTQDAGVPSPQPVEKMNCCSVAHARQPATARV